MVLAVTAFHAQLPADTFPRHFLRRRIASANPHSAVVIHNIASHILSGPLVRADEFDAGHFQFCNALFQWFDGFADLV